jgi:hypothetical protein
MRSKCGLNLPWIILPLDESQFIQKRGQSLFNQNFVSSEQLYDLVLSD